MRAVISRKHKRFWQAIPTKSVVHVIEETFLVTSKIVEFHDISCTWLIVVGQDTPISALVVLLQARRWSTVYSLCRRIEVVLFSGSWCVCRVVNGQFLYSSQYGVCTAGVEGWVQGQVLHQVGRHVFNTWAAAEIYAHQEAEYLAVLVTADFATQSQSRVYLSLTKERQIAPWLQIFLLKEWVSQILFVFSPCLLKICLI